MARDSSTLISAKGNVQQAILTIKAYMGMDTASSFEVDTPPVDKIPVDKIAKPANPKCIRFRDRQHAAAEIQ